MRFIREICTGLVATALTWTAAASGVASAATDIPTYSTQTYDLTAKALAMYRAIAARGGWPELPATALTLGRNAQGPLVAALKQRLAIEEDLPDVYAEGDVFDADTEAALKRFQARHGLSETGTIGKLTLKELNEPVATRIRQLEASSQRMMGNGFVFTSRYVTVNIPGASVEAINNGRVELTSKAVVGRPDRRSPVIEAKIQAVNLNPTWTPPLNILKADIMPKVVKDPGFLAANKIRVFNAANQEIDPATVDWTGASGINFWVREDPSPTNSLGYVRIDMPNAHDVYMHDTPKRELFRSDVRFHSSGCSRVQAIRDLAAWLLQGTDWTRDRIERQIATGQRQDIRLPKTVPVAWIYFTGWGSGDGTVQFREDVYGYDTAGNIAASTVSPQHAALTTSPSGAASLPHPTPSAMAMDEH